MTLGNDVEPLLKGHRICSEFEAHWGSPQRSSIESLVAGEGKLERALLLKWLFRSEMELRVAIY